MGDMYENLSVCVYLDRTLVEWQFAEKFRYAKLFEHAVFHITHCIKLEKLVTPKYVFMDC